MVISSQALKVREGSETISKESTSPFILNGAGSALHPNRMMI